LSKRLRFKLAAATGNAPGAGVLRQVPCFRDRCADLRQMPRGTHSLAPRVLADCHVFACLVDIPEMAHRAEARRFDG
jgi:hypothetical protein